MKSVIGFDKRSLFFLLFFGWSFSGYACAETVELVTYYPSSGGGGNDPQVNSIRVGNGYAGTAAPGNGIALVETSLGIGIAGPPTQQIDITGNFQMPATTAPGGILGGGAILSGGNRLIHNFGTNNFFAGVNAGNFTTTGQNNTGTGVQALFTNTLGNNNTALGVSALQANTVGNFNTALGVSALQANNTGANNTSVGSNTLQLNTAGSNNTAVGAQSLAVNTGDQNTAVGRRSLFANTTAIGNTAVGSNALVANTIANNNTAIGQGALPSNTTGANNTAVGNSAGTGNITGSNNVFIGSSTGAAAVNLTNAIAIGFNAQVGASNALVLGGTGANAVNVGIGTAAPAQRLHVMGTVRIVDGTQAAGRVLTSDANGVASWQPPPAGTALLGVQVGATQTFNNSGNSSVTQTVNLSGFAGATFVQLVSELESAQPSVISSAAITFNFRNAASTTILSFPFRIKGGDVDTAFDRDPILIPIPSNATSIQIVLAGDNAKSREQAILRFYQ